MLPAYVEMLQFYGQMGDLARAAQVLDKAVKELPGHRERLQRLYQQIQGRILGG